jgi:hypothetical protein
MHIAAETVESERSKKVIYNGADGTCLDKVVHMCNYHSGDKRVKGM